jgi:uncharacterized protein (TIGR04255 family)
MLKIANPPLISFRVDFKFKRIENISISKMHEVDLFLKKHYQELPKINVVSFPPEMKIPISINPIEYTSEDKERQLKLFANSIIFIYSEYSSWVEIKEDLFNILEKVLELLEIKTVEEFRLEYTNQFEFKKENFRIKEYFNMYSQAPPSWDINYKDYHNGLNLKVDNNDKFIIRLRGIDPQEEDTLLFRLEHIYLKKQKFKLAEKEILLDSLDETHNIAERFFLDIMTENLKKKRGVEEVGNK